MKIIHNKLVRDKIPEIIRESGKTPFFFQLEDAAYIEALDQKLLEEVQEYQADRNLEEMADILEVLYAICEARGYTVSELKARKQEKAQKRGGFKERLFLEYVDDDMKD